MFKVTYKDNSVCVCVCVCVFMCVFLWLCVCVCVCVGEEEEEGCVESMWGVGWGGRILKVCVGCLLATAVYLISPVQCVGEGCVSVFVCVLCVCL